MNSWRWQGVSAKGYITFCEIEIKAFQIYACTSLIVIPSTMSDANPPGGVNLTIAIFALVGAVFSIVGFIVHYSPRHQYGDFCSILHDINDIFADYELLSLLPSDQGSRLYQRYRRHVHALLTTSRLPRVASTDVVSNTVFLLIWNHFVIWSQYHPTCWYFMFGQL